MKVEGVNNFYSLNFQVKEISRPAEVLSREEVKFFEELFPESVEEIKKYYQYDYRGRLVIEVDHQIINKRV